MALNPDHFLDHAEVLVAPRVGRHRQVNLRRAISSAYYGLFHFVLTRLADEMVGAGQRGTARYALVYRTPSRRGLRTLCLDIGKSTASRRMTALLPSGGFDPRIVLFTRAVLGLQEARQDADYHPLATFTASDAASFTRQARDAMEDFAQAAAEHRRLFLTLLLCPPRDLA